MAGFLAAGGCNTGARAGEEMDKPAKSAKSRLLAVFSTGAGAKAGGGLEIKENAEVSTVAAGGTWTGGGADVGGGNMNANAELLVTGA